MCLTVEPGIYFIKKLLLKSFENDKFTKYLNILKIKEEFMDFGILFFKIFLGGIRIEDNIVITNDGYLNLTSGLIKEIDDIEKFMENK
jgi:Xaa-Pro dipeptidase